MGHITGIEVLLSAKHSSEDLEEVLRRTEEIEISQ